MTRSLLSRLLTGASAAALAVTGLAAGPAQAAVASQMFSYADGWRVDRHVRELGDVDGDGRLDAVGFGDAGVWVAYAQPNGTFTSPVLRVRDFGTAQGWTNARHVRTVADMDGDGREDLVGFGDAGVHVSYALTNGTFTAPQLKIPDFGWNQGWRVDKHPRVVADLTADRAGDVVGFGSGGVHVSHGRVDRTFSGTGKRISSYGYDHGWRVDKNPRLLADMDGNGTADIVGFGDAGTYMSYFSPLGDTFTAAALKIPNFGYAQGWRVGQHPRAVGLMNVDGLRDVVGFGYGGVFVAYGRGGQFATSYTGVQEKVDDFGTAQGWRGEDLYPRTLADVNVDGIQDLVGFGTYGVHVAEGRADSTFGPVHRKVAGYGTADGWTEDRYPRLLGDVNGDGRDDVVGFGHSATYVTLS